MCQNETKKKKIVKKETRKVNPRRLFDKENVKSAHPKKSIHFVFLFSVSIDFQ